MYGENTYGMYKAISGMEFAFGGKKSAPPAKPAPVAAPAPVVSEPEPEPEPEGRNTKAVERTKVRSEQKALASLLDDETQGTTII